MELRKIINRFPNLKISKSSFSSLLYPLKYFSINLGSYLSFSLFVSLFSLLINPILFPLLFILFLLIPSFIWKQKQQKYITELPRFLRTLHINLSSGLSIDKVLSNYNKDFLFILEKSKDPIFIRVKNAIKRSQLYGFSDFFKLADDIENYLRFNRKSAATLSSMISLLFISLYIVIPTFLIILYGLPFIDISDEQLFFVLFILIPIFSLILIFINGSINLEPLFSGIFLLPIFIFPSYAILFSFFAFLLQLYFFIKNYKKEKEYYSALKDLPSLFISASSLKGASAEKIILSIASYPYFNFLLQVSSKKSTKKLLDEFIEKQKDLIKRAFLFLKNAYMSGYPLANICSIIAEDLIRELQLRAEKESILSMQKYTIIFSSLLVPLALYFSSHLIIFSKQIDLDSIIISYLLLYSIFSSLYIYSISYDRSTASIISSLLFIIPISIFYLLNIFNPF